MEIRFLRQDDDLFAVSNVYEASWKYAYKGMIPQDYLDSIPKGKWAGSITKAGMHALVMIENGCIIGTACICRSRWEDFKNFGEIVSIYFLPEYIGNGYGTQMLKRCIEELKRFGFTELLLWVLEDNIRARLFYEKNGFRFTGEYRNDNIGGKDLREMMYQISCK